MTCNLCGVQEATIHLTEILNNQMIEVHMCEPCAQEKGTDFKTHFNLDEFLAGFSEQEKPEKSLEKPALICSECHLSYEEFGKTGRLGCAHCYVSFFRPLLSLIRRVQRADHHEGRKPPSVQRERMVKPISDLKMLQDRLRKSIQLEEFEEAARIRDEIRQNEERIKKPRKPKSGS